MNGLVIKNTGSWVIVRAENGKDIPCKVKGNFRLKGLRTTNPVAIGDRITLNVNSDGSAFITAIEPRKNYIIRRASNLSKESHILAANIDRAFLIATLAHPATSTTFIDRSGHSRSIPRACHSGNKQNRPAERQRLARTARCRHIPLFQHRIPGITHINHNRRRN